MRLNRILRASLTLVLVAISAPLFAAGLGDSEFWQNSTVSACCGTADSYCADYWELTKEGYVAVWINDTSKSPECIHHDKDGKRIAISVDKLQKEPRNTTGHGIIFINNKGEGTCYFPGAGI